MALVSNLYPPIVPDTTIVFSDVCRIPFTLSAYNSMSDIKNVQISLTNLKTNASGFNDDIVQKSSGIKIVNLRNENNSSSTAYIEISTNDMANNKFEQNQFYKVQLRFTSTSAKNIEQNEGISNWLYENRQYFSEWSKIVLIKKIPKTKAILKSFDENEGFSGDIVLTQSTVNIVGKIFFESNESCPLKNYNIKLYEKNSNTLLYRTEELFPQPPGSNEINYELIYDFQDAVNYTFVLTYTTLDDYVDSVSKSFYIIQSTSGGINKIPADINVFQDSDNGRIKIQIISNNDDTFLGNIIVRRTSSQSNFHKWEDVHIITYSKFSKINVVWYDKTVKSGVWYKYGIQKENAKGFRGIFTQCNEPVMCLFDDIFLIKDNAQLKINFNPSLSEFKYNVFQSQQNPIGSKFPFIKRNSANFFRTFPIGGLISSFMDTSDWYDPHFYNGVFHNNENQLKLFTSKNNVYKNSKTLYDNYNKNNNINEYQDYIYEREFRQKVYDFLYANDVKLFKSTTQGNILIKLMNIDFQPIESLGRRLYSFTANAVQIDESTILNFDKYGIQTIGKVSPYIELNYDVLGQVNKVFNEKDSNILKTIIQKKQINSRVKAGYKNEIQKLKWVRIEITSPPYVIVQDNNLGLIKATSDSDLTNSMIGYIVIINDKKMIISPSSKRRNNEDSIDIEHVGYFQLKGDNIEITNLSFPYSTEATIDYIATFSEYEDFSTQVRSMYYDYRAGQLYDLFNPTDSVFRRIFNKYLLNYSDYYQRLINISGIALSGPPKTTAYVKDSNDLTFNRHVLENGFLQLRDEEASINGLYFCGVHLEQCTNPLQTKKINGLTNFTDLTQRTYDSLSQIEPINGGIYAVKYLVTDDPAVGFEEFAAQIENHIILVAESQQTENNQWNYVLNPEYNIISPEKLYTLLLDRYQHTYQLYFAYYYGCWYLLPADTSREATSDEIIDQFLDQFRHDIRYLRQDEYILTGQSADTFEEITDPIPNGVYTIAAATDDNGKSTLNGTKENINNVDLDYSEILNNTIIKNSNNRCIYYKNQWYHFTKENDVLCPVEAIVDYYCEIEKGVY